MRSTFIPFQKALYHFLLSLVWCNACLDQMKGCLASTIFPLSNTCWLRTYTWVDQIAHNIECMGNRNLSEIIIMVFIPHIIDVYFINNIFVVPRYFGDIINKLGWKTISSRSVKLTVFRCAYASRSCYIGMCFRKHCAFFFYSDTTYDNLPHNSSWQQLRRKVENS